MVSMLKSLYCNCFYLYALYSHCVAIFNAVISIMHLNLGYLDLMMNPVMLVLSNSIWGRITVLDKLAIFIS